MTADIVIRGGTVVDGTGRARPDAPTSPSPTASSPRSATGLDGQPRARRRRARSSRPASSTSTRTTTRRCSGTRRSRRRAGTASRRSSPATAASRSRRCGPSTASCSCARCSTSRTWRPTRCSRACRGTSSRRSRSTSTRSSSAARCSTTRATSGTPRCASSSWARRATSAPRPTTRSRSMQQVIAEAMAAGAAGFATSSSPTHNGDRGRPVPSRVADLDELLLAARAVARRAQGRRRAAARREGHARRRVRAAARRRPSRHVDRAAHGQGLPVAREDHGGEHRRPAPRASRCGRRSRAGRSRSR